jgi:hypothetical protein
MIPHRHPDWHGLVRRNWGKTTAFLLATCQPCLEVRDREVAAVGDNRNLQVLQAGDLAGWQPNGSWLLAVLLCGGDETRSLASWARKQRIDAGRIHFYLHVDASLETLEGWHQAGLPLGRVTDGIDDWKRLHKFLGLALNETIAQDHATDPT